MNPFKMKNKILIILIAICFSSCSYLTQTGTQALKETQMRLTSEYVRKTQMKTEDFITNKVDSLFIKKKKKTPDGE